MRRFLFVAAIMAVAFVWFGSTAEAGHRRGRCCGQRATVVYSSVGDCCDPCSSGVVYSSGHRGYRSAWRTGRSYYRPWSNRATYRPSYSTRQRGFYATYSPSYSSGCSTCGG